MVRPFLADNMPRYRVGETAGEEIKLGSEAAVAQLVLLGSPKEVASIALIAEGKTFGMQPCEASIEGGKELQAFEVASKNVPGLFAALKEKGYAKLVIHWRRKGEPGKVYTAERVS
jgi:hypothetical protein